MNNSHDNINNSYNNSIMNKSSIDALAEAAMKRELDPISTTTASLSPSLLGAADLKFRNASSTSPSSSSDSNLMAAAMAACRPSVPGVTSGPGPQGGALPSVAGSGNNDHSIYLSILNEQRRRSLTSGTSSPQAAYNNNNSHNQVNPLTTSCTEQPAHAPSSSSVNYASMMQSQFDSTITAPSRRRKPNFAEKLHQVLNDKDCRCAIAWLPSGRSFCITDQAEFVKTMLPKFFREAKFESFSRRLKRWGFRKVYTTGLSQIIFSHDLFHRDRPDLCKIMNGREKVGANGVEVKSDPSSQGADHPYVSDQFRNAMMYQQAQQQQMSMSHNHMGGSSHGQHPAQQQQAAHPFFQQHQMAMQQQQQQMNQQRAAMLSNMTSSQGPVPPPANGSPSGAASLRMRGASSSPVDLNARAMISQAQAIVARSMPGINTQVNPEDPSTIQEAKMQLGRLNDDIANCEEQLMILQQLKELKEKRRMLTGVNAGSPRGVSPSST